MGRYYSQTRRVKTANVSDSCWEESLAGGFREKDLPLGSLMGQNSSGAGVSLCYQALESCRERETVGSKEGEVCISRCDATGVLVKSGEPHQFTQA